MAGDSAAFLFLSLPPGGKVAGRQARRMRGQWRITLCLQRIRGLLCPRRQSNQNAAGDGSGWTLRVHIRLSPDPSTENAPVRVCKISGAQNLSGTLNSSRATGPWFCKNFCWCGSASAPGLPNQLSWYKTCCRARRLGAPFWRHEICMGGADEGAGLRPAPVVCMK